MTIQKSKTSKSGRSFNNDNRFEGMMEAHAAITTAESPLPYLANVLPLE
jgi:hypothetical protein